MVHQPPIVLSIAGSDCSSGAGIQADLKTFSSFGCYGLTAVTGVAAEIPGHLVSIKTIQPEIVRDQVNLLFKTYQIASVKTGMLFSTPIIKAVAEVLGNLKQLPFLVVDPVMVISSGDSLLALDGITAYRKFLFPLASLLTPNLDELCLLAGNRTLATSLEEMKGFGRYLMQKANMSVLLKGGHLQQEEAIDVLLMKDGGEEIFTAPFLHDVETHGAGCTYSAAIVAGIAQGYSLPKAVATAKNFVTQALKNAYQWETIRALRQNYTFIE